MAKTPGWTAPKKTILHMFSCQDFPALAPTGAAAVMMARNRGHARQLLADTIRKTGRPCAAMTTAALPLANFVRVDFSGAGCAILCDGDY